MSAPCAVQSSRNCLAGPAQYSRDFVTLCAQSLSYARADLIDVLGDSGACRIELLDQGLVGRADCAADIVRH